MDGSASPHDPGPLVLRSAVPAWARGMSLLDYLCRRFPYHDRAAWQTLLDAGSVTLHRGGKPASPPLQPRDEVAYRREHEEPEVPLELILLHADQDLAAASKPGLLPSHADGVFVRHTFIHRIRALLADHRANLVHRLDRETSGVMVVGRTPAACRHLEGQFRSGAVQKRYLAIVQGTVAGSAFTVDAAIGRARSSCIAIRRAVVAAAAIDARPARTSFKVRRRLRGHTLLEVEPHSGRTHQIRVHLEHVGHPLVGDKLYGRPDADYLAWVRSVKAGPPAAAAPANRVARQLLHAASLGLVHPRTGAALTFAAELPADMAAFVARHDEGGTGPEPG